MKYAVYSSDRKPEYSFFGPISALFWRKVTGHEPLVLLADTEWEWNADPKAKFILERYRELGVKHQFYGKPPGASGVLLARLSRWFAAFAEGLNERDYVMTADIDIWPLDEEWFSKADSFKAFTFWFANAHNYEFFATCYIGATVHEWKRFMGAHINPSLIAILDRYIQVARADGKPADWPGWNSDEWFMREYWTQARCPDDDRHYIPGDYGTLRIDRATWPYRLNLDGKVDAHLLRPGYKWENWQRLRPIVEAKIPEHQRWVDDYRRMYMEVV